MSSFRKPVIARDTINGGYVNGTYQGDTFSAEYTISASVQPLGVNGMAQLMESLPEGRRVRKAYRLYTDDTINEVGATNPTQVQLFNEWYEIYQISLWTNNVIDHNKYVAAKMDEDLI